VTKGENFMRLGRPRRIWAVAACNGAAAQLERIHGKIADRFGTGDRVVYLGNYLGCPDAVEIVDSLLAFRTYLLAGPGMIPSDLVYLRGIQEEIWSKLLQIQFAPNPREVLRWMLDHGAAATLQAYGGNPRDGLAATMSGAMSIARWTNRVREAVRRHPGHEKFMTVLQRAALTEDSGAGSLLFVHAGIDPARALGAQGDSFWWGAAEYDQLVEPFETFKRVFRGFDPAGHGARLDGYAVTLDTGASGSSSLIGALIAPDGQIIDIVKG
jgi:hypothetical protein